MPDVPVLDLSPTLQLMLTGMVLAAGPLIWVWLRHRKASLAANMRALTLVTLFLTFDLVLFGAFTRLTDSGLGCPDWPGCYGHASPLGAAAPITSAQQSMPTGPVTHTKAWIEMIHRYLATGVGVLILTLTVIAWWHARRPAEPTGVSPWWPTMVLAWVCVQGAFGALTVTMRLFPLIVTLHLLGGLLLLALLALLALRYDDWQRGSAPLEVSSALRLWVGVCIALLAVQIGLGGWVSTNYAVLACSDFPTCQGRWWPDMALAEGFRPWRELGMKTSGESISFAALTGIHVMHRLGALVLIPALMVLVAGLWRHPVLRRQARLIIVLVTLQVLTGVANVVLGWPLLAAVLHTGGAAGLLLTLTWLLGSTRGAAPTQARRTRMEVTS